MTKIFLRFLNAPALVILLTLGIAVQTSLFGFWPLQYLQPDIVLIAVVWFGLKRKFIEGGILTLIISAIAESHSAAPQGLFLITYMSIYLLVRMADRTFVIPNLSAIVMLTLFSSVLWKLGCLGVLSALGASSNQWRHTLMFLFPGAVIEGSVSIWAFRWLDKFDVITFKNLKGDDSVENEFLMEGLE